MQLSPLRYPGGKSKASKILIDFVPSSVSTVVSPFFGGGSFENFLALRGANVYGYDFCKPLVNFWTSYLGDKERFFTRVRELSNQILSLETDRVEQKKLYFSWKEKAIESEDVFESGTCYFALNRSAFSGMTLIAGPMSNKYIDQKFGEKAINNLEKISFPVKSVSYQDCIQTIEENRAEFLYLDPPYVMETKEKEAIYGNNGDMHKGFDHVALRDALNDHKGQWVLSYLDVPEVRELYSQYNITNVTWRYTMKPGGNRPEGKELVITNF